MTKTLYVLALSCALTWIGCGSAPQPSAAMPENTSAAEAAIRKLDADWVKAAQTKSADAWLAFYAADATVLPPNEAIPASRDALRKSIEGLLTLPNLSISWEPAKVEVAKSGELGYLYGAYDLSFTDPKGGVVKDHGKNVEIWKKQADGGWKCIVDTWNSDLPLAPPSK